MLEQDIRKETILVTGASGFVGSFIVEEALRRDMEVWAAVRKSSSLRYLQDERIHKIELDLSSAEQMITALQGMTIDYVVHAAGLTKALHEEDFFKVNTDGTKNLVTALQTMGMPLKRFVFISSLSVMGAIREEEPHKEIRDTDTPQPNTAYGRSKLAAEEWLRQECRVPFTILRPTGIYGPREKDYMMMADSIRCGVDIAVGYKRQDITFIYVKDVVQAVLRSMESDKTAGKAYFLSDGEVYTSKDFSDLIIKELGKRYVLRITFPLFVLRLVCAVSDIWMHVTGKLSTLNNDHYNILCQRNWLCDTTPARNDFGYAPEWTLKDGVNEMLKDK